MNGGYNLAERCPNFIWSLIQYVNEGDALFNSHDQFDNTHDENIKQVAKDMLSVLGFIYQNIWSPGIGTNVYFEKKSAIKNSIFSVNQAVYWYSIQIANTHQSYSIYNTSCETCNVILKFVQNDSDVYEYLVTNRPNRIGNTINIRAGHMDLLKQKKKYS